MIGLPVHPRLARMIAVSPTPLACVLAAIVDERDVLRGRPDDVPADIAIRVRVVAGSGSHDQADRWAVERLRDRAADIAKRSGIAFDRGTLGAVDIDASGATLLLAFPDRLAGRRRAGQFQLRTGSGAWLPDTDPLAAEALRGGGRPRRQARPRPDPARRGDRRRRRGVGVRRRARRDAHADVGVEPGRSRRERRAPARLDPPRRPEPSADTRRRNRRRARAAGAGDAARRARMDRGRDPAARAGRVPAPHRR